MTTSTNVAAPTSPSFQVYNLESPNTIAVSGTTNSNLPTTDQVDLLCYYGPASVSHKTLASGVSLNPITGSFSVPTADLNNVKNQACTLRAIPAGTTPSDLTPFTGPVLATGSTQRFAITGGTNDGAVSDYYTWVQQLTAADDYDSYGSCGLCDGYLIDSNLSETTTTFFGNDWFHSSNRPFASGGTRSEVQVDGVNAYSSRRARQINPGATSGFPALTYSNSLNPSNGNLTITESDQLVKCPNSAYPPTITTCPSFVSSGVTVNRTITQESDGRLVFITDNYQSTDGQQHTLDLLPENEQRFSDPGNNGLNIGYQFPGEGSFSTHGNGAVVTFPDSAPATVYVHVNGSTDGDHTSGQGAIVFDRPVSPATFTSAIPSLNSFHFHQTGLVTATCAPTFGFAYAQDYIAANVQGLAQMALSRFNASPATVCSPPSAGAPPSVSTGRRAAALKKCKKKKSTKARKKCRRKAKKLPV